MWADLWDCNAGSTNAWDLKLAFSFPKEGNLSTFRSKLREKLHSSSSQWQAETQKPGVKQHLLQTPLPLLTPWAAQICFPGWAAHFQVSFTYKLMGGILSNCVLNWCRFFCLITLLGRLVQNINPGRDISSLIHHLNLLIVFAIIVHIFIAILFIIFFQWFFRNTSVPFQPLSGQNKPNSFSRFLISLCLFVCLSIQVVFPSAVEIYPSWMQSCKDTLEEVSQCFAQWQ